MSSSSETAETRTGDRIAKLLARAGVASRREVERMIAEGRVKIGDEVVTTPNTVLTNLKGVTVDGNFVKAAEPAKLFAFHKPSGLITAERDPAGRPTIYTALRNALPPGTPRLMPVGRLDFNTEGLLLLTNDGELKRAMELPSSGIPRTYRARTFGEITQAQLEDLIEGIEIDGMRYGKIDANMERSTGRNQWIEVTLTEGKNREVRRVLEHLGLEVSRLLRLSYGPFELLDLPRGAAIEIRQVDVEKFRKALTVPGSADVAPRAASDPARARVQRTHPSTRPAREPDRQMSEVRTPRKPLARKPDPERAALESARPRRQGQNRPEFGRPESGRPESGRPESRRSPSDRSDTGRAEYGKSDQSRSGARGAGRPYADKSSGDKPYGDKSGGAKFGDRRPDSERSDASRYNRTGSGRSGNGRPGTDRSGPGRPTGGGGKPTPGGRGPRK